MPDFVYFFRATPASQEAAMGTPEAARRSMQLMMDWVGELESAGHLKDRGLPLEMNGRVVSSNPELATNGAGPTAGDIVVGYIVVTARSFDEAVALASECPMAVGGAAVEVRPVARPPFGPSA